MSHDLVVVAVLVSEHAAAAVVADLGLVKCATVFSSEFVIRFVCHQFFVAVGKLTFFTVAAAFGFNPIFAQILEIRLKPCNHRQDQKFKTSHYTFTIIGKCT